MKYLIIIMCLSSGQAVAEIELEARYSKMNYTWWDDIRFPVNAYLLGGTAWNGDFGLTILWGESDTAKNTGKTWSMLSSKIENLTIIGLRRRRRFKDVTVALGLNYVEYREHVTGPGVDASNMDFGEGYSISAAYHLDDSWAVKASFDTLYSKYKDSHSGYERTASTSLSITYRAL